MVIRVEQRGEGCKGPRAVRVGQSVFAAVGPALLFYDAALA